MSDTIGFGLVGAGLIAPFHAKSLRDCNGGRLAGVCDVNRERAAALAETYGARAYADLDEMLADPDIRAVCVLTPNHLHYDAVMRCAAAGRHVVTEKPPAMSLRETDEMVEACRRANVKFACSVQCRVRAAVRAMRSAVENGRFGRILQADATMKWFRSSDYYRSDAWRSSRQSGAGVTIQHAFHYIDLLQHLAGPVAAVEARMTNLAHPEVKLEDSLLAFVTFRNGGQGVVNASTALYPGTDVRIEVNGENGTAVVVGERMAVWRFRDERPEDEAIRRIGDASQATAAGGAADFGHADHQVLIQDVIDAIREDREVIIPVASVRHTLEIALAMYQSAARGRTVNLPVADDPSIWTA